MSNLEISEDAPLSREMVEDKAARLDIKVSTPGGLKIDLEMQRSNQYNMEKRTFYYLGRLYTEDFPRGANYRDLPKVIAINLLDFEIMQLEELHHCFQLWDSKHKRHCMLEVVEIHFIQLPPWRRLAHKDLHDPLHRWLTFFDLHQPETMRREAADMDTAIAMAQEILEKVSSDRELRALAQKREDAIRDYNSAMQGARDEGMEKGIREVILDMLQEKEDYFQLKEQLESELNNQKEVEKLKIIVKKAVKAQSVKQFMEELKA